jgi:serine phosphatase RsbU (regulator of sigma subunit)/HAMP domain-containing protein
MTIPFKNFKISLKLKILISFSFLVIAIMLAVTYIFTIRELNLRVEQVKSQIERIAENIATIRSVETENWDIYQTYIDNQLNVNKDIIYIGIFDEQNELKVFALNANLLELEDPEKLSTEDQANIIRQLELHQIAKESQKDFAWKSVNIVISGKNKGTVNVGFSLIDLNDEMKANLYQNLLLSAIFLVLAIITSLYLSSKIVTPLGKLTRAMLNISKGDLNQEVHISSKDEIGDMSETFNYMTKGLQEKQIIEDLARELGFVVEIEKITQIITMHITDAMDSKQGYFFLRNHKDESQFNLEYAYPQANTEEITLSRNKELCQYFIKNRTPHPLQDLTKYPALFSRIRTINHFDENALIIPVIIKNEVNGILLLSSKKSNLPYTDREKTFLTTLIGQGGFAIESAYLYEELKHRERIKQELEIARRVQADLLPQGNLQIEGLDIDGICIPAAEIGGDYYDYFLIDNHTVGIAIADVTGKGTSAAFYMAMVKGMMLSLSSIHLSPKQLLTELNKRIFGKVDRRVFITMIYAVIDVSKKSLKFARAGHNALIMRCAEESKAKCLIPAGMGLGLEKGELFSTTISEKRIKLKPGDTIIFYTDGVSDAMNHKREEFGEERLIEIIENISHNNSSQIRQIIIHALNEFVKDTPQHDDITMLTIRATF